MIRTGQNGIQLIAADENGQELRKIRQDSAVLNNLSEVYTYSSEVTTSQSFAIRSGEATIGALILKNIRWFNRKTEITLYLDKKFQGQGIGSAVLELAKEYIFLKLDFHRIGAEVFSYNQHALRLFEKSGFSREGILREARYLDGRFFDIIIFGLLKSEYLKSHEAYETGKEESRRTSK